MDGSLSSFWLCFSHPNYQSSHLQMPSCSRYTEQKSLTKGTQASSTSTHREIYSTATLCKPSKMITWHLKSWSNITHSLVRRLIQWQKLALSFNCRHLPFRASLECRSIGPHPVSLTGKFTSIRLLACFQGCGYHIKLNSLINILRGWTIKHHFRIELSWLSRKNSTPRAQTQPAVLYPYISTR